MKKVYSLLIEKNCRPLAQDIAYKYSLYSLIEDLLETVAHFDFNAAQINRCPKCGQKPGFAKLYSGMYFCGWRLECFDCGLYTGCCKNEDEAIAKWNELAKKSEVEI